MILKRIKPIHFGPFIGHNSLIIDPEVTVLTGPNDVGKSLALRAIQLLYSELQLKESEVNEYRKENYGGPWRSDADIICEADFEITEKSLQSIISQTALKPGSIVNVRKPLINKSQFGSFKEITPGVIERQIHPQFRKFPEILVLPLNDSIGELIHLDKPNNAEKDFIHLGFGQDFTIAQHASLSPMERSIRIRKAEDNLNARLKEILPPMMKLSFMLQAVASDQANHISVALRDEHGGMTPLGSRGAGLGRLLSIMGALLRLDPAGGHTIVLYDEPETSLHADAQHMLRRLLEGIASNPTIQVVYTTHSPAMINNLRPNTIRVLERKRVENKAISVFVNEPYPGNYALVRSSLGMSPADSLMYSPITIVAEGPTEVRCLPHLLKKLADAGKIDPAALDLLLSQTHILDGEGSSFEYMCRLAKSQNARPIVLIDGDKSRDVSKVKEKHPEVPIIILNPGEEFENLVPRAKYIEAASILLEDQIGTITEANFKAWIQESQLPPKMMFSKQIDRWLEDEYGLTLSKPSIMAKAIELTDAKEIVAEKFLELFEAMKKVGESI